jgi:hypothetical protein
MNDRELSKAATRWGREAHDAGLCGVRGWFEPWEACRMRRNDATSIVGSRPSGESRSGYFHDPDDHLWEIVWHPQWSTAEA